MGQPKVEPASGVLEAEQALRAESSAAVARLPSARLTTTALTDKPGSN